MISRAASRAGALFVLAVALAAAPARGRAQPAPAEASSGSAPATPAAIPESPGTEGAPDPGPGAPDADETPRGAASSPEDVRDAPPRGPAGAPAPAPIAPAPRPPGPRQAGKLLPGGTDTAQALRIVIGLTLLAIVPALVVSITPFLRTIIVLSMLRHGLGMNATPPNTVLIGLSLFLTLFTMSPVLQRVNHDALQPFLAGRASAEDAYEKGIGPVREFMVRQTQERDLALMVEISRAEAPRTIADVSNVQLVPAYMLSELRAAFQIGFVVLLPFLLIDLVVSSILMALGMMMMPPITISLPLKVMMFVLVDGWSLLVTALVGSFR